MTYTCTQSYMCRCVLFVLECAYMPDRRWIDIFRGMKQVKKDTRKSRGALKRTHVERKDGMIGEGTYY